MLTPEELAELHERAYAGQGRAWSGAEFGELLASPHVFVAGDARAFALGRVVADEAELLTIATDPEHRRCGLGRVVLAMFETDAKMRGAVRAFLEVAEDNAAAMALYAAAGYREIDRRTGYYRAPDGGRTDAVVMDKPITGHSCPAF